MRRPLILRSLPLLAMAWLMLLPGSASAFPVDGSCTLELASFDAQGKALDTATGGDGSASAADPLQLDWDGKVSWSGASKVALQLNHYGVTVFGLPTAMQGGSPNTADVRTERGALAFKASAPFRFAGLYYVTAQIEGSGGTCRADLVVKLVGDPVATIPFFVGFSILAIGLLLVFWGPAGHLIAAMFGGLFVGLGSALLLVTLAVLPLGAITPLVVLVLGLAIGALSAIRGLAVVRARAKAAELALAVASPGALPAEAIAPPPAPVPAEPVVAGVTQTEEASGTASPIDASPADAASEAPEAPPVPGADAAPEATPATAPAPEAMADVPAVPAVAGVPDAPAGPEEPAGA